MTVLGPNANLFRGHMPVLVGITTALLFLLAFLHHQRDVLPYQDQDLASFTKGTYGKPPVRHPHAPPKDRTTKSRKPKSKPTGHGWWSSAPAPQPKEMTFLEIAKKARSDKVIVHAYQEVYAPYLQPLRHEQVKMLVIGLGCEGSNPGPSYQLFTEFFSEVDLYFIEPEPRCAQAYAKNVEAATVVQGDQQDIAFLERFLRDNGTGFDVIIDDGGHTMAQQQVSLQHLWKAVRPGGLYFIEDLQTSWQDTFGGGEAAKKDKILTTIQYIQRMVEDMTKASRQIKFEEVEKLVHIDCARDLCVFQKKGMRERVVTDKSKKGGPGKP